MAGDLVWLGDCNREQCGRRFLLGRMRRLMILRLQLRALFATRSLSPIELIEASYQTWRARGGIKLAAWYVACVCTASTLERGSTVRGGAWLGG